MRRQSSCEDYLLKILLKNKICRGPVERWVESKIMALTAYLSAAVYYFLYSVVDQKKAVTNQAVADLFKVLKSNLHQITSGQKYAGGSITTGRKLKSVQELEEHGEQMVKIAKVKPKPKSKKKVVVMKTTPKLIPLPFLEEPTEDPRRSRRKKDKDKKGR